MTTTFKFHDTNLLYLQPGAVCLFSVQNTPQPHSFPCDCDTPAACSPLKKTLCLDTCFSSSSAFPNQWLYRSLGTWWLLN